MKTKEELEAIRNEINALGAKLASLSEEELAAVSGGFKMPPKSDDEEHVFEIPGGPNNTIYELHVYPSNTDPFEMKGV